MMEKQTVADRTSFYRRVRHHSGRLSTAPEGPSAIVFHRLPQAYQPWSPTHRVERNRVHAASSDRIGAKWFRVGNSDIGLAIAFDYCTEDSDTTVAGYPPAPFGYDRHHHGQGYNFALMDGLGRFMTNRTSSKTPGLSMTGGTRRCPGLPAIAKVTSSSSAGQPVIIKQHAPERGRARNSSGAVFLLLTVIDEARCDMTDAILLSAGSTGF